MSTGPRKHCPSHLSTDSVAEHQRVAVLREFFGRKVVCCEFEPLSERPRADITLQRFGNIDLAAIDHSLMHVSRSRQQIADGNDGLVLQIAGGGCRGVHYGRDIVLKPGDAMLISNADIGVYTCFGKTLLLNLSRRQLRPLIADLDSALTRRVPNTSPILRLLRGYLDLVERAPGSIAELQHLIGSHVYDLVAVTVGATDEATENARGRGVRAARLHAIKADILAHLADHTLCIDTVAARQGITPVYIRKLFAGEPLSFSAFVLEHRLSSAQHLLTDHRFRDRAIGGIAFDAGFGDLSYFNRTFRRRFGASPSDIRAQATQSWRGTRKAHHTQR